MTIEGSGEDDLDLTSEQKSLVEFYNSDQADKLTEHHGPRSFEGAPEEAPTVEEVLTGDEDDGEEIHRVRQEERGTPIDNVREEEAAEEELGRAQYPGEEEDRQEERGINVDCMDE